MIPPNACTRLLRCHLHGEESGSVDQAAILRRMRFPVFFIAASIACLISCGSEPKSSDPTPPKKVELPKPSDESRRFPKANHIETKVVDQELMGKPFMPGGTLARYKKGARAYDMFAAKLATPLAAAVLLPDWRKALTSAKLIPSFGGYYGEDAGRPVFVFCKGAWIAGVAGLPLKEADTQARILAAQLN